MAPAPACTSSTRSPAARSCWASRWPNPRAPSTAQVRSGHAPAHATSHCAWLAEARTHSLPSGSSAPSIATAVCDPLCGSTPIITATTCPFPHIHDRREPRRACLITDRSSSHLLRATPRRGPAGRHVVRKPDRKPVGSGYESQPSRTSERYGLSRNACTDSSIRRIPYVKQYAAKTTVRDGKAVAPPSLPITVG